MYKMGNSYGWGVMGDVTRQHWEGLVVALGEVQQVILDCLSGAGGEASFQDDAERAIEIPQTLTVAEGIPPDPNPIGIILTEITNRIP